MDTIPMTEIDSRHRALSAINRALDALRDPYARPVRAIAAFISFAVLAAIVQQWFIPKASLTGSSLLDVAVNVLVGVVAAAIASRTAPDPAEALERLDRLLAAYEPAEPAAHAALQDQVRERGALDPQIVAKWLQRELAALSRAAGDGLPEGSRFLARQRSAGQPTRSIEDHEQGARA